MGDWLPRLVNFAIIAGVVVYFTRKPIRDFFKNRPSKSRRPCRNPRRPVSAR